MRKPDSFEARGRHDRTRAENDHILAKMRPSKLLEEFRDCASLPLPGTAQREGRETGMPMSSLMKDFAAAREFILGLETARKVSQAQSDSTMVNEVKIAKYKMNKFASVSTPSRHLSLHISSKTSNVSRLQGGTRSA